MPQRVHELAKELNISNKDLLDRIKGMGIEVKSHMSVLDDINVTAIKNAIIHSKKKSETKIVKVASKKIEEKEPDEVKVIIKPAAKAIIQAQERKQAQQQPQAAKGQERTFQTPPPGKPMPKTVLAPNGKVMPQGKPMPKKAVPQNKVEQEASLAEIKEQSVKVAEKSLENPIKPAEVVKEAERADTPVKTESTNPILDKKEEATAKQPAQSHKEIAGQTVKQTRDRTETSKGSVAGKAGVKQEQSERRERAPQRKEGQPPKREGSQAPRRDGTQPPRRDDSRPAVKKDLSKVAEPSVGNTKPSGHKKQNEKDRRDKREKRHEKSTVIDLTKAAPKKHRKNKAEKVTEQVQENNIELESLPVGTKIINVPITVKGLSEQIEKTTSQVIMALMKLGIMANVNQNIDEDTAVLLGAELGVNIVVDKVAEEVVEEGLELFEDKETDLVPRPPIITVMGHVDHGKTSLLDAIRKTSVTDMEAGGITQHIGASEVMLNGQKIVFLDTPGHEAFTAMRARGAHVTDIAILVVAADDSVKPQTIESISHARAAGVPIIVAVNKIDKPGANPDRVKQDLTEHGILVEDWGGDTIAVPVSAKTGEGIVHLLEMVLLQAEVLELKANPNRLAMGTVIEARLDKAKGPVATLLVLNGTLQAGMSVVAGTCSGRIRAMTNFKGDSIRKAGPATAVEILGLTEVPEAGDEFNAIKEDKTAREIAEKRKSKLREEIMVRNSSVTLEQLFSQIEEGEVKELNLIIKADVQGSVGALTQSLEKLKNENVKVRIVHSGVGTVTESDIMLANTSNAIIIGFNVRPSTAVTTMAERNGVEIRTYRIIYEVIDDIEAAMKGMLDPVFKEAVMGKIQIRETFKVPGVGIIGGAYVLEGKVQRNAQVRLVRDGIVIHEGKISSLKRYKDDAKEVNSGYECGIGIENYNDIKEGDIIEAFKMEEIERK